MEKQLKKISRVVDLIGTEVENRREKVRKLEEFSKTETFNLKGVCRKRKQELQKK